MGTFAVKQADYELSELLHEVMERGYVIIHYSKVLRLLGKGNRAAGTWKALLDAWEEVSHDNYRETLFISEITDNNILLTWEETKPVKVWAGEA